MKLEVSPDGFFTEIFSMNKKGEKVFPYLKSKRNSTAKGFDITLTGKKEDYKLVSLDQLVQLVRDGEFDEVGRVRMKPRNNGADGGFSVRKATMSEKLISTLSQI